jgi:hypothetical protein
LLVVWLKTWNQERALFVYYLGVEDQYLYGETTMKRLTVFLAAIAFVAACPAYANWSVADKGTWPKSWPAELEPLRKQSRSLQGGLVNLTRYEIPFTKREDFEAAWPHLLKVKSKGAPLILFRGPDEHMGKPMTAGVRIQCPPQTDNPVTPAAPIPGHTNVRARWLWTTFIELVVDGDIVDLNRIPLPEDTPIIDKRFEDANNKSLNPSGG